MLDQLKQLHAQMLVSLDELESLTKEADPPMDRLPAVRLALTRASRARTALLERAHGQILELATTAQRAEVEALRAEAKDNLILSSRHIGLWTIREIVMRWGEYCAASKEMRAAMRRRISREMELFYPLLGRVTPRSVQRGEHDP